MLQTDSRTKHNDLFVGEPVFLCQALDFSFYDIDILALRMKRETRHAEDVARDGNDHASACANHEVAHGEGEAFWHTDGLRIVAE